MEPKKLRRSYKDKMIGGVAGGLGEYFVTDPLIFRILFVVLLFTGGAGFPIYLLMWIFIPKDLPRFEEQFENPIVERNANWTNTKEKSKNGSIIGGSLLIVIGLFFLLDNFFPWLDFAELWPIALVIAGLAIIKMNYSSGKNKKENEPTEPPAEA